MSDHRKSLKIFNSYIAHSNIPQSVAKNIITIVATKLKTLRANDSSSPK